MGSVKDLKILKNPTFEKPGEGIFTFSNRYSIFDWGGMPDHIDHKGKSIALLGAYFFEKLDELGISNHYMGLMENGDAKNLSELNNPSKVMKVKLLRVITPKFENNQYDYNIYSQNLKGNFLIPLEIIYRNVLPEGSSVFKRLNESEIIPEDLGLKNPPVPNQKLKKPLIDFSTKLEVTDRYLRPLEAQEISSLSEEELDELKDVTTIINKMISQEFSKIGLKNEDGKIEFGYGPKRQLMVVDVLGTLDECRFTFNDLPVSKEITRMYYRDTEWHCATEEAKKKDRINWKDNCALQPKPLPPKLKNLISQVYCSCTNEITGKEWFKDVMSLKEILKDIKGEIPCDK
ncbi:MAG: phosphoribosylaminoimidazolesuccinocarboxamide synthase [Methanobacterium sp.]|uniref:phosphoribosylaminoimidazolesuccinocarboxamide synthase n=1 Tax=Methanobacterium sp. TaxID=2164 RepID=UPI003D64B88D|nr:phosphoribosylaminoimidazolesuccinocarboxamide synthase [Methanobacterium sp.]